MEEKIIPNTVPDGKLIPKTFTLEHLTDYVDIKLKIPKQFPTVVKVEKA